MYNTFQITTASSSAEQGESGKSGRPNAASRRISTSNACVECRRRKIRCDGLQPCAQCQWYQHPEQCVYAKPVQRVVPSRKLVEKLQSQVEQYHAVFARLFPGKDVEDFVSLPRAELIDMAVTLPAASASPSHAPDRLLAKSESVKKSEGADSLDALEQAPEQDPNTDEAKRLRDKIQGISDDINGLSLSIDRASSYVGVSSINAAMKVIFKTAPMARPYIAQAQAETAAPSRSSTPPPYDRDPDPQELPPADEGNRLIDSYFAHVHVLMPMIEEDSFRHSYLYGSRRDSSWLCLLNMVLALGSLASTTCTNEDHMVYYQRARKHMEVETFGSGSLFTLQAFALLSGYYLHWLNRPNEANGIMGATLRMATAHGLHREYSESRRNETLAGGNVVLSNSEVPVEIRRRTWWSLYVLDSWASITTGRPSLGRTGDGITIENPRIPEQMNNAQYLKSLTLLPIIHNIPFCKIATKVQDILAAQSNIGFEALFALDAELEKWHDDLPPMLRDVVERPPLRKRHSSTAGDHKVSPRSGYIQSTGKSTIDFSQPPDRDRTVCPEVLKTPRAIMRWRYQNLKILMHRPILLATALRRTPWSNMSAEERLAVGRCRIVASQTISDIVATCQENLIAGWNAVWMMYQAVMIPLVSLFSVLALPPNGSTAAESPLLTPGSHGGTTTTPGSDDDLESWKRDVEKTIPFFDRMQRWSVAASKSRDVVQRLYDATKYVAEHNAQYHQQQQDLLQRRMSLVLPVAQAEAETAQRPDAQADAGSSHDAFAAAQGVFPAQPQYGLMQPGWTLSPGLTGEAAVNQFWDEMMWDTFPTDMPDNSTFVDGMGQDDWWPQQQDWTQWPGGSQM
ncbi:Lactose regulatory protein LAC9 [Cercospora beticola]|uniref:Lactose regulatory protein LAC9 n=1 Tax=Cercospora beticola TaxID=122368 RepID=A0A2G5I333_CERBT|nr:Lactose regulatory protein LAC9 [Cercospora beticola]PIA99225.1 Lactose regulatory protein LAC9 [Cercospora beticola]WPB00112.1 hypothetical protein RHO25_004731 [Cercospora beticola]CAK1361704.1 unnamed protein product [Cercospora beticola]